jgi:hypothetical protein
MGKVVARKTLAEIEAKLPDGEKLRNKTCSEIFQFSAEERSRLRQALKLPRQTDHLEAFLALLELDVCLLLLAEHEEKTRPEPTQIRRRKGRPKLIWRRRFAERVAALLSDVLGIEPGISRDGRYSNVLRICFEAASISKREPVRGERGVDFFELVKHGTESIRASDDDVKRTLVTHSEKIALAKEARKRTATRSKLRTTLRNILIHRSKRAD